MANVSLSSNHTSDINVCIPWTKPVYLYGHLIPSITLFIFGVTFNPIALYYFATSRNFRRSAYSYYFSTIAVVDLLRLIIWCSFLLLDYKIFKFNFHSFECPTQMFSESVVSSISSWLTVALTVERCLVTYKPLQALTDTKGKRALIIIFSIILASCAINSLFLQPGFYEKRVYIKHIRNIVCYYETSSKGNLTQHIKPILTAKRKRLYTISIIIIRVVIPFMLLLVVNMILFLTVRRSEKQSVQSTKILLVRHGHHRQITPMIFFSSCILLLTVSPRYLHQFYVNFFQDSLHCSLMHFAPHILKTLELFNYSFNVFISIVSGKHGRHELFTMLLCRSKTVHRKIQYSSINQSSTFNKAQYQQRLRNKTDDRSNPTHKPLLSNHNDCHGH